MGRKDHHSLACSSSRGNDVLVQERKTAMNEPLLLHISLLPCCEYRVQKNFMVVVVLLP